MADLKKDIMRKARQMVDADKNLHRYQEEYERMARLDWTPPGALGQFAFIRGRPSTAPYDALRGAVRAMANLQPKITVHPATVLKAIRGKDDNSLEARKLANQWETTFHWVLDRLIKRSPTFLSDIVWSSVLYHEVNGQPIHLPTQKRIADTLRGTKGEAAMRMGDWGVKLADPKTVDVRYSNYGTDAVLSVALRDARWVSEFWGHKAIAAQIEKNPDFATEPFLECDYVDYENRFVWAVQSNSVSEIENLKYTLLSPQPWLGREVPFLPWINVAGGTKIDLAPEHQRRPLLYPVLQTGAWINANIMGTIMQSVAVAEAAAARNVVKGAGAADFEVDHGEIGGRINLTPFQTYERVQQLGLDPQIREMFDRTEDAIRRATVADVLVTGQPMGTDQTFAGFNLQVMQALASLGDFKNVAQLFISRLLEHMLLLAHYTGGEISGYGKDDKVYTIDSEDIDPEGIYIDVELTTDVPVDRQQRVNAAMNLANSENLPMSPRSLLEFLGVTDPEGEIRDWMKHRVRMADLMGKLKKIELTVSGEIEQMAAKMAQQMIQDQMKQQQAPEGGEQMPGMMGTGSPPEDMMAPPGMPGVEGQEVNPAAGGMPPAMANPMGNTFEGQTGMSRGGQELAGL